jgi:hypothetical protein
VPDLDVPIRDRLRAMKLFATDHPLKSRPMSRRIKITLAIIGTILAAGLMLFIRHIDGPRFVARAVAPDGTEMCIVQQFNWSGEPFTTSFVYRRPGSSWGRFYFDHQDDYWKSSRVVLDTNRCLAVFFRGGAPAITFSWATETYTMHRWRRTLTGAQWRMPGSWRPVMSVE